MSFERHRRRTPRERPEPAEVRRDLADRAGAFARTRAARALGITLLTFLIGYTIAARWLFPSAEDPTDARFIDVPDLVGVPAEEARRRVADAGLLAIDGPRLHHADLAPGTVAAQSPLPGQVAVPGDTLVLTLSAGSESRTVPDLAGLAGPEAADLLRGLGFDVELSETRSEGNRAGVLRTSPPAGTRLALPETIEVFVTEGTAIVTVPDLRGRHVDDVEDLLTTADLQLGAVRYQIDAPEADGRVVSQSPAGGSSLRGQGFVAIVVAGEPPDSVTAELADEPPPAPRDTVGTP